MRPPPRAPPPPRRRRRAAAASAAPPRPRPPARRAPPPPPPPPRAGGRRLLLVLRTLEQLAARLVEHRRVAQASIRLSHLVIAVRSHLVSTSLRSSFSCHPALDLVSAWSRRPDTRLEGVDALHHRALVLRDLERERAHRLLVRLECQLLGELRRRAPRAARSSSSSACNSSIRLPCAACIFDRSVRSSWSGPGRRARRGRAAARHGEGRHRANDWTGLETRSVWTNDRYRQSSRLLFTAPPCPPPQ